MKIHEYQAKNLLKNFGVPVQDGVAITSIDQYDSAISSLVSKGINQYVVKSQIHAGGRGKGIVYSRDNKHEIIVEGGVKFIGKDVQKEMMVKKFRLFLLPKVWIIRKNCILVFCLTGQFQEM